ncbi:MAG: hypothetical protein IKL24_00905, partial [Clostridia bacterium]|nr:hypothetical protein [Clostridia bacterium]
MMAAASTICVFVAPLMVQLLFSVFNKRSSSDFFHSLPYTRPCIFLSFMASIYTWIIGICTTCSAVSFVLYAIQPSRYAITLDRGFDLILSYFAILLISTGAATIAMSLTGTNLTNVSVAFIILFLPRFIINIITSKITYDASFIVLHTGSFSFLDPRTNVLFGMFYGGSELFTNTVQDIYSIILGLAYLTLGMLVFIKRKSETATRPAPDRITQTVIRVMASLIVALFALTLLFEEEFTGFVVVSAIAVIIYFTYEVVTTKSFKNCLRALPGLGILAGITALCGIVMAYYPVVASGYTPDAESINSVRFVTDKDENYYYYSENSWFAKGAEGISIKDKKVISIIASTLKNDMGYYSRHGSTLADSFNHYLTKVVAIKEGPFERYRRLSLTYDQYAEITAYLQENEAYREAYKKLPNPVQSSFEFVDFDIDYSPSNVDKLMEALRADIAEMEFIDWYNTANNQDASYYDTVLSYYSDEYNSTHVSLYINANDFPKTFSLLLEMCRPTREKGINEAEKLLADNGYPEDSDIYYAGVCVYVRTDDEKGDSTVYYAETMYGTEIKYESDWNNKEAKKAIKELLKTAKPLKEEPTAESYICVQVYEESENEDDGYSYKRYTSFLPIPEGFDPVENGFVSYDFDN